MNLEKEVKRNSEEKETAMLNIQNAIQTRNNEWKIVILKILNITKVVMVKNLITIFFKTMMRKKIIFRGIFGFIEGIKQKRTQKIKRYCWNITSSTTKIL